MIFVNMQRVVNNKIRYYNINVQKNLFKEFVVEIEYGSIQYKKPTRTTYIYFVNILDAVKYMTSIKLKKLKRNYIIKNEKGINHEY